VGCGVEVAAPGGLAPFFWIAVTRIEAGGGAFASNDEIDVAKVGRVLAGARGVVLNSSHDGRPVSGLFGGWSAERSEIGPIDRVRSRAERLPR